MCYLKSRLQEFSTNIIEWSSCILNLIMCLCMAYFYYDSELYAPLFYSIFFFSYIVIVFLLGEKVIPFMYLLFLLGATQNITFINCTGFFIVIFLSWQFKKQKYFVYIVYVLEIFLVCFRHKKSVWHLLCHFAFCSVYFILCHITKKKIEQEAINEAREKIKEELESEYYEKLRTEIIKELQKEIITQTENLLILQEHEENLIRQLSEGKMLKEIDGISKNTKTDYIVRKNI